MMTVHEVSERTGVSIRALQYYDRIGLLHPAQYTEAGYRLYGKAQLETLQQILLFRELEFPLREIRQILESPSFDRQKALDQQIALLQLKRERLDSLISLARETRKNGGSIPMDFSAFDTKKLDEYAARAKASWGSTPEYQAYEKQSAGRTQADNEELGRQMMAVFADFGMVKDQGPASEAAQALVRRLQAFISAHYYPCSDRILASLGSMYASSGDFTANIDRAGGAGTAAFVNEAIQIYCTQR